jgi:chromosome segregation ATPase
MVSLEQVRLLESKVTRTVDYVKKLTEENKQLKGRLDSYHRRIEELEVLIQNFKEDQSRIEDGILSALDRLNQFEDALETTLSAELPGPIPAAKEEPVIEISPLRSGVEDENIDDKSIKDDNMEDDSIESAELDIF